MKEIALFMLCLVNATAASAACNGSDTLCTKRYDHVTFLATRASMSSSQNHFVPPNQHFGLVRQLNDGVRAFFIEIHEHKHTAYLCQHSCDFGSISAFEAFYEMAQFMAHNPSEVITLIMDERTDANLVVKALRESGLSDRAYTQVSGTNWPTLGTMIDLEKPLVIFSTAPFDSQHPWRHNFTDFATTIYDIDLQNPSAACSQPVDRTKLLAMHHTLDKPYVIERRSEMINSAAFLSSSLQTCIQKILYAPNFLAVDFYDLGAAMNAVQTINSLRASLP